MSEPAQTQQNATPEKDWPQDWPNWAPAVLTYLEKSPNMSRAAEHVGVERSTVYRLRDRDERFALALFDAREKAIDLLEESVYADATSGLPHRKTVTKKRLTDAGEEIIEVTESEELVRNPTLAMFFLKRWRPEYRESFKIEQTGAGGGPIQHDVNVTTETGISDFYAALDELRPAAEAETPAS